MPGNNNYVQTDNTDFEAKYQAYKAKKGFREEPVKPEVGINPNIGEQIPAQKDQSFAPHEQQQLNQMIRGTPAPRPELPEFGSEPIADVSAGQDLALASRHFLASEPQAQADIVKNNLPGAKVEKQLDGSFIVSYRGKKYELNRPGVSHNDAKDLFGQIVAYIPAAKLPGMVSYLLKKTGLKTTAAVSATLPARAAIAGTGAAATSVAQDIGAATQGSEQGVNFVKAAITGALGGVGEIASPVVIAGWKKLFGANPSLGYVQNGALTQKGQQAAQRMGLDPGNIPPEIKDMFLEYDAAARKLAPTGADAFDPGPSSYFGIRQNRGQATGNIPDQQDIEAMRQGSFGDPAQRIIRDFDAAQSQDIQASRGVLQGELNKGTQTIDNPYQPGGRILTGVKNRAQELEDQVAKQYQEAFSNPLDIKKEAITKLPKVVQLSLNLSGRFVDKGERSLTPATLAAIDLLKNEAVNLGKGKSKSLISLDFTRRKLNQLYSTAPNDTDRGTIKVIQKTFDKWIQKSIDDKLIEGDPKAINELLKARKLRREYSLLYEDQGNGDAAGKVMEMFVSRDLTPEEVIDYTLGRSFIGHKRESAQIINRLGVVLGRDSDEFNQLRESAFMKLTNKLSGDKVKLGTFINEFDKTFTEGQSTLKALFSEAELAKMRQYRDLLKKLNVEVFNPSGTSYAQTRIAKDYLKKLSVFLFATGEPTSAAATAATAAVAGGTKGASNLFATVLANQLTKGTPPLLRKPSLNAAGVGSFSFYYDDLINDKNPEQEQK